MVGTENDALWDLFYYFRVVVLGDVLAIRSSGELMFTGTFQHFVLIQVWMSNGEIWAASVHHATSQIPSVYRFLDIFWENIWLLIKS